MKLGYYKSKTVVGKYEKERFTSVKGRYIDFIERGIIHKYLKNGSHLDVGCGTGRFTTQVGIDFSYNMIQRAKALHPSLQFRVHDARKLPFAECSFSNVTAIRLLYHLKEWKKVLREMIRVCAPKGRIIFDIRRKGLLSLKELIMREEIELISIKDLNPLGFTIIETVDIPPILPMTTFIIGEKN